MRQHSARLIASVVAVSAFSLAGAQARAATLWNESSNGDLSNSGSTPTALTASNGVNAVIGNVTGGTDTDDWLALTIPAGFQLTQEVLESYQSTDSQGFTGFGAGATFPGSINTPANYLGYSHFGTGATNGSLPATNLIGQDLLAIEATPADDPGSTGFTDPLAAGTYTFVIQQLGASTSYEFDFVVSPVPEPASLSMLAGGLLLLRRRRA